MQGIAPQSQKCHLHKERASVSYGKDASMAIGGWDVHNRSKDDRKQSEENRKSDCASTQSLIHAKRLRRKNYASTAVTRRTASRNWSSDLTKMQMGVAEWWTDQLSAQIDDFHARHIFALKSGMSCRDLIWEWTNIFPSRSVRKSW